jgi:uncharacterized protein
MHKPPPPPSDRIVVLDVLRGIALLGMFVVHFNDHASSAGGVHAGYRKVLALFFTERFLTMFGILFGVSFAIQFQRAYARGDGYILKYLRRTAGLAIIGFIVQAMLVLNTLLLYALWAIPLLVVRKWSTRALLAAAFIGAVSVDIYAIARVSYRVAAVGELRYRLERDSARAEFTAFGRRNWLAQRSRSYSDVLTARLEQMRWAYSQPWPYLPANIFTLFLLGLIGFRLGLFDRPEEHRRLIVGLMIFGAAAWAIDATVLSSSPHPQLPLVLERVVTRLQNGFGLIRGRWLAFTYIGAVLLLVARNPDWLRRLGVFGIAGRMTLTNYIIQVAIVDLIFAKYGFGVRMKPLWGLPAAIGLFLINVALSKWWLARFRYGPLEWLWRSITYWRWQPLSASRD